MEKVRVKLESGRITYKKKCGCGNLIDIRSSKCKSCRDYMTWKELREKPLSYFIEKRKNLHRSSAFCDVRNFARTWNKHLKGLPCQRCNYDKHTELAHIHAIADFDHSTPIGIINHPNNLYVLCPNCHWEFDNGLLNDTEIQPRLDEVNLIKLYENSFDIICEILPVRVRKEKKSKPEKIPIARKTKIEWPDPLIMQKMLWEKPTVKIAMELGVSDSAVGRFAKKHGLTKPPVGYWRKVETGKI